MQGLLPTKNRYGEAINHFEDDDFLNRLNNRWTVRVLVLLVEKFLG